MFVEYHINDGKSDQLASAHIKTLELLSEDYHIYLGGDIGEQNRILRDEPNRVYKKLVENYADNVAYLEDFCEGLITHEFIHVLLYEMTHSLDTVIQYDNIDGSEEICAPEFWENRGCE